MKVNEWLGYMVKSVAMGVRMLYLAYQVEPLR
jgi:hypothetical protein